MHELNERLKSLTEEMWKIKKHKENISVEELLNFCGDFYAYSNFWIDMIDSLILKDGLSEEEKNKVVDVLRNLNGNTYNSLIIGDLMEMDCKNADHYLREIISTPQLFSSFRDDFSHYPQYIKYCKLLMSEDNVPH